MFQGGMLSLESIGGQVVEQFSQKEAMNTVTPTSLVQEKGVGAGGGSIGGITIGEALEATVLTAGKKPVEWSDAAAIQAAEVRATGRTKHRPWRCCPRRRNQPQLSMLETTKDENKTKLADVLADATLKLPRRIGQRRGEMLEGVTGAEMRNDPSLTTHPRGIVCVSGSRS
ncbi:unnamed protein product [Vicia faba]|uniref:SMP domain-containing protein n=1 Tax=Vicia faba TaxID=3906 RepID=A0AAV0ZYK5_VICFA|nr:unnamed protein product [Vicia faba]